LRMRRRRRKRKVKGRYVWITNVLYSNKLHRIDSVDSDFSLSFTKFRSTSIYKT